MIFRRKVTREAEKAQRDAEERRRIRARLEALKMQLRLIEIKRGGS
jgi:hypothetical protein